MKVRYKGKTESLVLTHNKIYSVLGVEKGWYRLVDDSGEDYLYPPESFDRIIEQYDIVLLKDGRACTIVEVLEEGVAYLADVELHGPDWETIEIRQEDIQTTK